MDKIEVEILEKELDKLGIPVTDFNDCVYSLWGRVQIALSRERQATIEECAKVCESLGITSMDDGGYEEGFGNACDDCAESIRALIAKGE